MNQKVGYGGHSKTVIKLTKYNPIKLPMSGHLGISL